MVGLANVLRYFNAVVNSPAKFGAQTNYEHDAQANSLCFHID